LRPKAGLLAFAFIPVFAGCGPGWQQLGQELADHDGDEWYTADNNQRVRLIVESAVYVSGGGVLVPQMKVLVDDREAPMQQAAQERCIGTWLVTEPNSHFTFHSRIKFMPSGANADSSVGTDVAWHNEDSEFTVSTGGATIHLRTSVERFADPNPQSDADSDQDGILESEEARLARLGGPVGNPFTSDILLVVGYTHSAWALTANSREKLMNVFAAHGHNLFVMDGDSDLIQFSPGRIRIDGSFPSQDHKITLQQCTDARDAHIPDYARHYTHFLVLASELESGEFGRANLPGLNLVCRSHLPVIGADMHDYQAKDIMHELGHNLGLCHPTESDSSCPSGSIPALERDPAASVMGTPAEDADLPIDQVVNALSRPLDYSPGQWTNLDPASSRATP
jgi:hypothetical protein